MEKMLYIGSYTGCSKDSKKPYYVLYLGSELVDKNGNPIGEGYRPKTLFVDKDEYEDFQTCGVGNIVLADIKVFYDRETKKETNILKRYEV